MILRSIKKLLHKTIAAPKYLRDDPWFGAAILSDSQMTLKEAFNHAVSDNQLLPEDDVVEPKDIHEKIYQIAISSGKTTIQLNPIGGGSEIFQEKRRIKYD